MVGVKRNEVGSDGDEVGSDGDEVGSDGVEVGSDGDEVGSDESRGWDLRGQAQFWPISILAQTSMSPAAHGSFSLFQF